MCPNRPPIKPAPCRCAHVVDHAKFKKKRKCILKVFLSIIRKFAPVSKSMWTKSQHRDSYIPVRIKGCTKLGILLLHFSTSKLTIQIPTLWSWTTQWSVMVRWLVSGRTSSHSSRSRQPKATPSSLVGNISSRFLSHLPNQGHCFLHIQ